MRRAPRRNAPARSPQKSGFTFAHADGRPYGSTLVAPGLAQAFANAEGALRSMGFKSREARQMIDAIRSTVSEDASSEKVLYEALYAAPSLARPLRVSEAMPLYNAKASSDAAVPTLH